MKILVYSTDKKIWRLIETTYKSVEERIKKGIRDGETYLTLEDHWKILDELPPSVELNEDIPLFIYGEWKGMSMSLFYLER